MNEYEEALKDIKNVDSKATKKMKYQSLDAITTLVERRTARYAWYDSPVYRCPVCDENLSNYRGRQGMFCIQCGQKIVWE